MNLGITIDCISAALSDCTSINPDWNNVNTEPKLPVETTTTLTFICPEEYAHVGSKTGTCIDGQILTPKGAPDPVCRKKG